MAYKLKGSNEKHPKFRITLENAFLFMCCYYILSAVACYACDATSHPDVPHHTQRDHLCIVADLTTHQPNNGKTLRACTRVVFTYRVCLFEFVVIVVFSSPLQMVLNLHSFLSRQVFHFPFLYSSNI